MKSRLLILIIFTISTLLSCSSLNPPNSIDIRLKFSKGDILIEADDGDPKALVPKLIIDENTPDDGGITFKVNPIVADSTASPTTYNGERTANKIVEALRVIIQNDDEFSDKIILRALSLEAKSDGRAIVTIEIANQDDLAFSNDSVNYTVEINPFANSNNSWGKIRVKL